MFPLPAEQLAPKTKTPALFVNKTGVFPVPPLGLTSQTMMHYCNG